MSVPPSGIGHWPRNLVFSVVRKWPPIRRRAFRAESFRNAEQPSPVIPRHRVSPSVTPMTGPAGIHRYRHTRANSPNPGIVGLVIASASEANPSCRVKKEWIASSLRSSAMTLTHVYHLAATFAPESCIDLPSRNRGRRESRVPAAPAASHAK